MQNRLLRAAFLGLILTLAAGSAALAQCQINRLAANTVLGRLGIGTGPCEQIPIALLLANQNVQPVTANLSAFLALNSTGFPTRTGVNTWAQRSITGTSNNITVTNGNGVSGAPTIAVSATYAGQTSITTLGTITSGTWHGSVIHQSYGGFGSDVAGANGVPLFVLGVPTFTSTTGTGVFMRANAPTLAGNLILDGNWLSGDGGNEGIQIDSSGYVGVGSVPSTGKRLFIQDTTLTGTTVVNNESQVHVAGSTGASALSSITFGKASVPVAKIAAQIDPSGTVLHFLGSTNYVTGITAELFTARSDTGSFGIGTGSTINHTLDVNGNIGIATSGYLNWGATDGTSGYGLRDNTGTIQVKNSGGAWVNIPTSGTTQWTTSAPNLYFSTGGVSVGTTLLATGATLQVSGSHYVATTTPTLQQANCWGFANLCETDGFLSVTTFTGAATGGSAVRGDVSRDTNGVVVSGVSGSAKAGNSSGDIVGVLGSTLFLGGGTGYAGWFFTYICDAGSIETQCAGATGGTSGNTGMLSGLNRGEIAPNFGLLLSKEGFAETNSIGCCVTGVLLTDFTSKGFHAFNNKGAAWGFYQDNGSSTQNFGVDATGRVSFVGGTQTLTTLCYNTSDHGGIATIAGCSSDRRLKNEMGVVPDGALGVVARMRPSRFTFKNDASQHVYAGFYAQDLQPIAPEAVTVGMDGDHLTLIDDALIAYVVKAVQELDARTAAK